MVVIRLARGGSKKRPFYNLVAAESSASVFTTPLPTKAKSVYASRWIASRTGPATARSYRPWSPVWSRIIRPKLLPQSDRVLPGIDPMRPVPEQDVAASDRLIELGRIASAYGIKGWVKVQPHSAQAEVLLSARQWWLSESARATDAVDAAQAQPVAVLAARPQGSAVVAQFQGIADRTQAEALRGKAVWLPRSAFPPPDDDEYYWIDLIGCLVYGGQAGQSALLGRVADVADNGAHAVLKIEKLAPSPDGGGLVAVQDAKGRPVELLVPFVDAHLRTVDLTARRIDTNWPADF